MRKFIVAALLGSIACAANAQERLSELEFQKAMAVEGIQLIDVRTPEEFAKGHLVDAVNIDWLSDDFLARTERLDKAKPVLLYCAAGGRSEEAREALQAAGFRQVADLDGGILRWRAKQLPLITGK
ncbi:MAG TPA: rhodanese-like domain-containing protein [Flavobacteriales bacterium]